MNQQPKPQKQVGARIKNPCKDCRFRHIGCHSHCFLYKEWKQQTEVLNEIKRIKEQEEHSLQDMSFIKNYNRQKRHRK